MTQAYLHPCFCSLTFHFSLPLVFSVDGRACEDKCPTVSSVSAVEINVVEACGPERKKSCTAVLNGHK